MYDTVIIGAGVTGSAIARELSKYRINACVLERAEDICCGTSKANSAIIHAGYDALPNTLKAKLNVLGNSMMDRLAEELDIPFHRNGSFVTCTGSQDRSLLEALMERGIKNGVPGLKLMERNELLPLEPNLSEDVVCALFAPTAGIVCPFEMTLGLAENAFINGIPFFLNTEVMQIIRQTDCYVITAFHTDTGKTEAITARTVINAAGVYADRFNNMVSKRALSITARRGEYCLLDRAAGSHVSHTIFQLPSSMGKGVLVTPTVHGNLLIGPTAEDVPDREAVNTTQKGLAYLFQTAGASVKALPLNQVITSFAGLRAHEAGDDFVIGEAPGAEGFFNAAGIESPGLTSAPAIGVMAARMTAEKLSLRENPDFINTRKGVLKPETLSMEERCRLIRQNPAYGSIVCRCEMISEGEILDAIHRPLGARTLDGIKRRTRAGMGRCQAGFCSPRTMEILAREVPMRMEEVRKNGRNSALTAGRTKE